MTTINEVCRWITRNENDEEVRDIHNWAKEELQERGLLERDEPKIGRPRGSRNKPKEQEQAAHEALMDEVVAAMPDVMP